LSHPSINSFTKTATTEKKFVDGGFVCAKLPAQARTKKYDENPRSILYRKKLTFGGLS
jgi:hypothetical protein